VMMPAKREVLRYAQDDIKMKKAALGRPSCLEQVLAIRSA
jgi:hypothetical protein